MGLFTGLAEALARAKEYPPAPVYQPLAFANVGEALSAIHNAGVMGPGVAVCIAQTFCRTAAERLGLTEVGVWNALLAAHPDLTGCLWFGSMWDGLAHALFDNEAPVFPTYH